MKNIRMSSEVIIRYYIWLLQQNDTKMSLLTSLNCGQPFVSQAIQFRGRGWRRVKWQMAATRTIAVIKAKFTLYRLAFREDSKKLSPLWLSVREQKPYLVCPGGGGVVLPIMAYIRGGSARKVYLFQASGIWKGNDFTRWSMQKGREICHLGLSKGPPMQRADRRILWRYEVEKTFYFCDWLSFKWKCIYIS